MLKIAKAAVERAMTEPKFAERLARVLLNRGELEDVLDPVLTGVPIRVTGWDKTYLPQIIMDDDLVDNVVIRKIELSECDGFALVYYDCDIIRFFESEDEADAFRRGVNLSEGRLDKDKNHTYKVEVHQRNRIRTYKLDDIDCYLQLEYV